MKYRPNYQPKGFANIEEARLWCSRFVKWYRNDHRHSGIKFVTAAQRHAGLSKSILQKCHEIYEAAKAAHPERWNGRATRNWDDIEVVYLNPEKVAEETKVDLQATTQQLISA